MLLRLAAAGARGETPAVQQVDWPSLMPLAAEQGVVPLAAWQCCMRRSWNAQKRCAST